MRIHSRNRFCSVSCTLQVITYCIIQPISEFQSILSLDQQSKRKSTGLLYRHLISPSSVTCVMLLIFCLVILNGFRRKTCHYVFSYISVMKDLDLIDEVLLSKLAIMQ